ncbi:MAG: hypothetical protein WBQ41_02495 [Solirubrobacterales bacterium]
MVLHKGDGAARLTATWQARNLSDFFGPLCERSASTIIEGTTRGERPRFKLKRTGNQVVFVDHSCRHENLAKVGRVTITVHGEGHTRSAYLNDQCDGDGSWHPHCSSVGLRWDLCEQAYKYVGVPQLTFFAHGRLGLGEHLFRATIRFGKRVLAAYTIGVRIALR